jgi:hypothetical protein
MTRLLTNKTTHLSLALAIGALCNVAQANPITGAIGETKPIIDLRVRYESVDQTGFTKDADALTARLRAGFETGKAWNTSFLAEGEFVEAITDDYNSTTNGKTIYPVVADPKTQQLNRAQFTNTSITNTTITLGRQRINIDDQRFVGNVGWRQNEQTFDALRVVYKATGKLTLDATYSDRVNRVFNGQDSNQGVYKGDIVLLNAGYQMSVGKLTGFVYLMDFGKTKSSSAAVVTGALKDSNETVGARFTGAKPVGNVKITYTASYAHQSDYADNPLDFSLNYYLAEAGVSYRQWSASLGVENLEGDGVKGFTTPLATLHKFQGWADKFLATPAVGINDKYVTAGYAAKGVGPLETLGLTVAYHQYDSTKSSLDLGNEADIQLAGKWQRFTGTLKYADYSAAVDTPTAYKDTSKFWAQIEYVW